MDRAVATRRAQTASRWTAHAIAVTTAVSWRCGVRLGKVLWEVTKWAGRMTAWVIFWPFGMWRSHRRAQRREHEQLLAAVTRSRP